MESFLLPFDLNEPPPFSAGEPWLDFSLEAHPHAGRLAPNNPDPGAGRLAAASLDNLAAPATVHTGQQTSPAQNEQNQQQKKSRPRLSMEVRKRIIDVLLSTSRNNKLQRGVIPTLVSEYNTCYKTIYMLWARAKEQMNEGLPIDVRTKMKGCVCRKKLDLDLQKLAEVPLCKKKNLRSVASQLKVSKTTVHRLLKRKEIKRHSNAIKPYLTPIGKLKRLQFCLEKIVPHTIPMNPTFHHFYDHVHIDEKWFELTQETTTFYTLPKNIELSMDDVEAAQTFLASQGGV